MIDDFWFPADTECASRLRYRVGRIVLLWHGTDRVSHQCGFQRAPLVRTSEWWTAKILGRPFPF